MNGFLCYSDIDCPFTKSSSLSPHTADTSTTELTFNTVLFNDIVIPMWPLYKRITLSLRCAFQKYLIAIEEAK